MNGLAGEKNVFRCAVASLYEVVSVRPSVRPSVVPALFSKVKSTHTRRILCRVSGLVFLFLKITVDDSDASMKRRFML